MKMKDIYIPEKLIDAIKNDKLVIFAGAGVSIASPVKLPNFVTLCNKVSQQSKYKLNDNQKNECDRFLGMLHSLENIDVHKKACDFLQTDKYNEIHKLIVSIFKNKTLRIITTNYDHSFENYLKQTKESIKIYNNPALPYGEKFDGLVHIHGNIIEPYNMVLTDEDFGKAYMSKGQVSRFLIDVFENYNVLFIGYSYNDTIMKYLTRAMFNNNNQYSRYIITDDNKNDWSLYKIDSIYFENKNYTQLNNIIKDIGRISSSSYLDWKNQAKMICKTPKDIDNYDYLKYNLKDASKMKIFIDEVSFIDWIHWFNDYGYLDNLFNSKCCSYSDSDNILCDWISQNCFKDLNDFKKIYIIHQCEISEGLRTKILSKLAYNNECIDKVIYVEILAMLNVNKTIDKNVGIKLIDKLLKLDLKELASNIFVSMFEPTYIPVNDTYIKGKNYEITHSFDINNYYFEKLYEKFGMIFSDKNGKFVSKMINILENIYLYSCLCYENSNIRFQYKRLNVTDDVEMYYERDAIYYICEIIIDNFDSINKWAQRQIVEKCTNSKFIILHMLGLILLKKTISYTPNQKMELLLKIDIDWLYNKEYIFKLVAAIFDDLTSKERDKFIKYISKGLKNKDKVYIVYNWYVWLIKKCKKVDAIIDIKNKLEQEHGFTERIHPELNIWCSNAESIDNISPYSIEEIEDMSIDELIEKINTYKEGFFSIYSKEVFYDTAVKVLIKNYNSIILLLNKKNEINIENDFWKYFYRKLENKDCSTNIFYEIIKILDNKHYKSFATYLFRYIKNIIKKNEISFEDENKIFKIIKQIHLCVDDTYESDLDIDFIYFNSSAGALTDCFFELIRKNNSLNNEYKDFFIELLNINNSSKYVYAFGIIGRISYFFNYDRDWCINNMAQYFEYHNDYMFKAVWAGFAMFNSKLSYDFAYFIQEYFSEAIVRIKLFDSETRHIFLWKLSIIIIYINPNPLDLIYIIINNCNDDIIEEFYGILQENLKSCNQIQRFYDNTLKPLFADRISRSSQLEYNKIISYAFIFKVMCEDILTLAIENKRNINITSVVLSKIEHCEFLDYKYKLIIEFLKIFSSNNNINDVYCLDSIINKLISIDNIEEQSLKNIENIKLKYNL